MTISSSAAAASSFPKIK